MKITQYMYVYVLLNCISNTVEDEPFTNSNTALAMNKSTLSSMDAHVYIIPGMIDEPLNDTANLDTIPLQYPGIFEIILKKSHSRVVESKTSLFEKYLKHCTIRH